MAFDLASIKPTRRDSAARYLIHGIHKVGKSTLAADCPGVIFIPTEDGQDSVDAAAFPLCESWPNLMEAVTTLYMEKHDHKAVCIDSADWAETLARKQVCEDKRINSIEDIDYGKGYTFAADYFAELLTGLNALRIERGMTIILLAHTEIKKFNDPQSATYDRYQIKLHNLINKMVQEWCDVIGFAQEATTTKEEEKSGFEKKGRVRAVDLGRRVLRLERSSAFDAGNRYGLPAELPLLLPSPWAAIDAAMIEARSKPNSNKKEE